jgi:hypothetical protein
LWKACWRFLVVHLRNCPRNLQPPYLISILPVFLNLGCLHHYLQAMLLLYGENNGQCMNLHYLIVDNLQFILEILRVNYARMVVLLTFHIVTARRSGHHQRSCVN